MRRRTATAAILLALILALAGVGWLSWRALLPADPIFAIPRRVPPPKTQTADPRPAPHEPRGAQISARVDIRRVASPSTSARDLIDAGKLVVRTTMPIARQPAEVYRQLTLRGGIFVVEDALGKYWWLKSPSERVPLPDSGLPLERYALNRPRLLPADVMSYTDGYAAQAGERLFLVMPKDFEAAVLTEIERVLPEPLAHYASASVVLSTTPNGYLEFALTEVGHRQHGATRMNRQFRGL